MALRSLVAALAVMTRLLPAAAAVPPPGEGDFDGCVNPFVDRLASGTTAEVVVDPGVVMVYAHTDAVGDGVGVAVVVVDEHCTDPTGS